MPPEACAADAKMAAKAARQVRIILRTSWPDTKIEERDQRAGPTPPRCARRLRCARSEDRGRVSSLFAAGHREIVQRPGRCAGLRVCRCPARWWGADLHWQLPRSDA